jgi:hypothetical protein
MLLPFFLKSRWSNPVLDYLITIPHHGSRAGLHAGGYGFSPAPRGSRGGGSYGGYNNYGNFGAYNNNKR